MNYIVTPWRSVNLLCTVESTPCAVSCHRQMYAPRGVEVCVGMKQVEVRVIMYSA